jgi:hypothetical protein
LYQANAQIQAGKYQGKVDENNAQLADYQAQNTALAGSIEEERQRAKVRQMVGTQRAALAANGLDLSEGTPLDLVVETAAVGTEDALNIRYNAMREAWGYRAQAQGYRDKAKYDRAAGRSGAFGTLLTTGATAFGMASAGGLFGGGSAATASSTPAGYGAGFLGPHTGA